MPHLSFILFELVILVLFLVSLRHAWRRGPAIVWELLAGVIYGLILEWATIQQLHAYHYGHFLIMLGEVPLMVGVAWGTIIYSVRLFSNASSLPEWSRPILDGLLALNIDMAMDAIAIRLGMWDWGLGFERQYFGVPYANFWAWFWVVFSFSLGLRLLSYRPGRLGSWFSPLGAIFIGLLGVLSTNSLIVYIASIDWYLQTIVVILGAAFLLVVWLRPRFYVIPVDSLVFWVPFGIHSYFLTVGLISGVIFQPPFLLGMSLAMYLIALYLHRSTLRGYLPSFEESG